MAPQGDVGQKKSAHERSRQRGFEPPFNPTFIGTVAAFLFLSSTHYALYVPCVHWIWYLATSLLLGLAVPSWLFVALYNPVDPHCRANTQTSHEDTKYCNHCACYTSKDARTRHCYDCRKCVPGTHRGKPGAPRAPYLSCCLTIRYVSCFVHAVGGTSGFDHHCVYLQTCIGKDNYPVFFTLISSVWLWCLLVAALDVLLIVPSSFAPFGQPLNQCSARPS